MNEPKRRFFSGDTLQQALMQAANHYHLPPEEIAYRSIEKRHGFLKTRRKFLIEVDPDAPGRKPGAGASPASAAAIPPPAPAVALPTRPVPAAPPLEEEEPSGPEPGNELRPERGTGPDDRGNRAPRSSDRAPERAPERGRPRGPAPAGGRDRGPGRPSGGRPPRGGERRDDRGNRGPERGSDRGPRQDRGRGPRTEQPRADRDRQPRFDGHVRPPQPSADRLTRVEAQPFDMSPGNGLIPLPEIPRRPSERFPEATGPQAEAAAKGMELLLRIAGLSLTPRILQGDDRLEVDLSGEDVDWCFADDGEFVVSVEHLLPRIIRSLSGEAPLVRVDCDNFQAH